MSQRKEFIELYLSRQASIRQLCAAFGVSEKTGYKWIARYHDRGVNGLADRSRAPHHSPQRVVPAVIERIVALRKRHPTYGPRKLRHILLTRSPETDWPAASTIYDLLRTRALVRRRGRGHTRGAPWDASAHGLTAPSEPNDVWAADFKGQFRLLSGVYCYPLTMSDLHSRFLLDCTALANPTSDAVHVAFRRVFRAYGLPRVIRTDNGVPFAQPNAIGRLSRLAVWWIRLGIKPERIRPARPQENGQHERLHRTLKDDATRPASADLVGQQRRFDRFRSDYNTVRPHESLAMQPPAQRYTPSPRPLPRHIPTFEYPIHHELRLVSPSGAIRWRTHLFHLTGALTGEYVSVEETGAAEWTVRFGPLILGIIDERRRRFNPGVRWSEQLNPIPSL